jgi:hypothetical protein
MNATTMSQHLPYTGEIRAALYLQVLFAAVAVVSGVSDVGGWHGTFAMVLILLAPLVMLFSIASPLFIGAKVWGSDRPLAAISWFALSVALSVLSFWGLLPTVQ